MAKRPPDAAAAPECWSLPCSAVLCGPTSITHPWAAGGPGGGYDEVPNSLGSCDDTVKPRRQLGRPASISRGCANAGPPQGRRKQQRCTVVPSGGRGSKITVWQGWAGSSCRSTDCSVWGEAWTKAAAAAACALRTAWGWGTAVPATAWQALKPC